jgi:hypothetical protein
VMDMNGAPTPTEPIPMTGRPLRCLVQPAMVRVGAVEGGQPVAAEGGVEHGHARLDERGEERLELLRALGDPGIEVVTLPLGNRKQTGNRGPAMSSLVRMACLGSGTAPSVRGKSTTCSRTDRLWPGSRSRRRLIRPSASGPLARAGRRGPVRRSRASGGANCCACLTLCRPRRLPARSGRR